MSPLDKATAGSTSPQGEETTGKDITTRGNCGMVLLAARNLLHATEVAKK